MKRKVKKIAKSKTLSSPAKLNLFFRVLNKRRDGFHEIVSLYSKIDLYDELIFSISDENIFLCNNKELELESNLVVQARDIFLQTCDIAQSVSISLLKNIPIGAGLGGGSSNAATTLIGLNKLFDEPLTIDQLMKIAAKIGSDVPFFLSSSKAAYCSGRGEIISEVELPNSYSFWLATPKELSCNTPKVYQFCVPGEVSNRDPMEIYLSFQGKNPIFLNDLEPAAFRVYPKLKTIKNEIERLGFDQVVMTGSGSTFFCIGDLQNPFLPSVDFQFVSI